jgi:hypothetical protein
VGPPPRAEPPGSVFRIVREDRRHRQKVFLFAACSTNEDCCPRMICDGTGSCVPPPPK